MTPNPDYEEDTHKYLGYTKEMWESGVLTERKFRELSKKIKCWWFDQHAINRAEEGTEQ